LRPYRVTITGPRRTRPFRWPVQTAMPRFFLAPTASATANGPPSIRGQLNLMMSRLLLRSRSAKRITIALRRAEISKYGIPGRRQRGI